MDVFVRKPGPSSTTIRRYIQQRPSAPLACILPLRAQAHRYPAQRFLAQPRASERSAQERKHATGNAGSSRNQLGIPPRLALQYDFETCDH